MWNNGLNLTSLYSLFHNLEFFQITELGTIVCVKSLLKIVLISLE